MDRAPSGMAKARINMNSMYFFIRTDSLKILKEPLRLLPLTGDKKHYK